MIKYKNMQLSTIAHTSSQLDYTSYTDTANCQLVYWVALDALLDVDGETNSKRVVEILRTQWRRLWLYIVIRNVVSHRHLSLTSLASSALYNTHTQFTYVISFHILFTGLTSINSRNLRACHSHKTFATTEPAQNYYLHTFTQPFHSTCSSSYH